MSYPASGRVYISRNVVFDEGVFPFVNSSPTAGPRILSKTALFPIVPGINHGHTTNEPTNAHLVVQLDAFVQPQIVPVLGEMNVHGVRGTVINNVGPDEATTALVAVPPGVLDDTAHSGLALVSSTSAGTGLSHGADTSVLAESGGQCSVKCSISA